MGGGQDPLKVPGGPWQGLRDPSSAYPAPHSEGNSAALCSRGAHGLQTAWQDPQTSQRGTVLAVKGPRRTPSLAPDPQEDEWARGLVLGGQGCSEWKCPLLPAAPRPPRGADPCGPPVPLPWLARDRDSGRGQRHDRPHRGRAEAAATDGQPPDHCALQVSSLGARAPPPGGIDADPAPCAAPLDRIVTFPHTHSFTCVNVTLHTRRRCCGGRSQEMSQTHISTSF